MTLNEPLQVSDETAMTRAKRLWSATLYGPALPLLAGSPPVSMIGTPMPSVMTFTCTLRCSVGAVPAPFTTSAFFTRHSVAVVMSTVPEIVPVADALHRRLRPETPA
jgi:hypothetical protein